MVSVITPHPSVRISSLSGQTVSSIEAMFTETGPTTVQQIIVHISGLISCSESGYRSFQDLNFHILRRNGKRSAVEREKYPTNPYLARSRSQLSGMLSRKTELKTLIDRIYQSRAVQEDYPS
jgi:hypothetical protein